MLTRIAGNCFWLARYLERCENNARLLRMAEAHTCLPESVDDPVGLWSTALEVGGTLDDYESRLGVLERSQVVRYMVLDRDNPSGILACMRALRDNARTARHLLTEQSWEAINESWLEAQQLDEARLADVGVEGIVVWTIQRCRLIRGCFEDLWRDALPHVLDLGAAVERADFTARILAEMVPPLLKHGMAVPDLCGPVCRRWRSLLIGLGMTETWRRERAQALEPVEVLRLILLHPTSPHSLLVNVRHMATAITGFAGADRGGRSLSIAHAFERQVMAADIPALCGEGLHTFLTALTTTTNRLGGEVNAEHFT